MALRDWRKRTGLSLASISDDVGISIGHLSHLERGDKAWSVDLAKRIEILTRGEVTAASLLGLTEHGSRKRGVSEDAEAYEGSETLSVMVPLSAGVLKDLRDLGVDAENIARAGAQQAIKEAYAHAWREANREAIDAYNVWIERHGTLAEQFGLI